MPETSATSAEATQSTLKPKFDPEKPDPDTIRACRSLTVRGIPCRQRAVKGADFCVKHFDRNKVTLSTGDRVAVPPPQYGRCPFIIVSTYDALH